MKAMFWLSLVLAIVAFSTMTPVQQHDLLRHFQQARCAIGGKTC